jgi:hypothetical protein
VITEHAVEKHVTSIFSKLDLPQASDHNRRLLADWRICAPERSEIHSCSQESFREPRADGPDGPDEACGRLRDPAGRGCVPADRVRADLRRSHTRRHPLARSGGSSEPQFRHEDSHNEDQGEKLIPDVS